MAERPDDRRNAPPLDEARAPLFSTNEIRIAFVATMVGMAGLLVLILVLSMSRPQGTFRIADDTQVQGIVAAAAEDLDGYELVGENRARIDIDRAIEVVAERGVGLTLTELGAEPAPEADAGDAAATAEDGDDAGNGDAAAAGDPVVDGEAVYAGNCAACHQASGAGIPGAFPPLSDGRVPALAAAEGGRDYLLHAVLFGVQGQIEVQGQTYDGVMPGWAQLSDAEIAAVLNHALTGWGDDAALPDDVEPFAADEVADLRGEDVDATAVVELRPDVD